MLWIWKRRSRFSSSCWLLMKNFPYYSWCFLKNLWSSLRKMFLKYRVFSLQKTLMHYVSSLTMIKVFPKSPQNFLFWLKLEAWNIQLYWILLYVYRYFSKNGTAVQISYFWNMYRFYFSQYIVLENISASQLVEDCFQDLLILELHIDAYVLHSICWLRLQIFQLLRLHIKLMK